MNDQDFIMPEWSKYRGESIDDVPRHYLEWLQEQDWIDKHPELSEEIEDQLAMRDRSYVTF